MRLNQVRIMFSLAAIFLAAFVTWTVLNTWAGLQYQRAREITNRAALATKREAAELQAAMVLIDGILRFYPNNPDYLDTKGLLLEYSADLPGVAGSERRLLLNQATARFRQAISNRPLWPYSWANLLSVKDKLGQIDADYLLAFERSDTLGPWEPPIQLLLIHSALAHWPDLGANQRRRAENIIRRAMKHQGREVFGLVQNMGRPDVLCPLQATYPQIRQYCHSMGMEEV